MSEETEVYIPGSPIPIVGCDKCNPKTWVEVGRSRGAYRCVKCKKLTNKVFLKLYAQKEVLE